MSLGRLNYQISLGQSVFCGPSSAIPAHDPECVSCLSLSHSLTGVRHVTADTSRLLSRRVSTALQPLTSPDRTNWLTLGLTDTAHTWLMTT